MAVAATVNCLRVLNMKNDTTKPAAVSRPLRLLVPVDFSNPSREALRAAVVLARRFGSRVAVAHVTRRNRPDSHIVAEQLGLTFDTRRAGRAKLDEFMEREFPADLQSTSIVVDGVPFDEIVKAAASWEADIIVIATHGYTGLKHVLLGSTAERVVRHAPCPVFVVRGRPKRGNQPIFSPDKMGSILVPTDFSGNSLAAVPHAVTWAREFGAKIIVLYVVPEHLPAEVSQIGLVLHERRAAKEAERNLIEFCRVHFRPEMAVETRVVIGPPGHTICETARELGVGLIAMGSRGQGGFKRLMVGSVTERVVQSAPCPVLVAR